MIQLCRFTGIASERSWKRNRKQQMENNISKMRSSLWSCDQHIDNGGFTPQNATTDGGRKVPIRPSEGGLLCTSYRLLWVCAQALLMGKMFFGKLKSLLCHLTHLWCWIHNILFLRKLKRGERGGEWQWDRTDCFYCSTKFTADFQGQN